MKDTTKKMLFTPCRNLTALSLVLLIAAGILTALASYLLLNGMSRYFMGVISIYVFQLPTGVYLFLTELLPLVLTLLLIYAFLRLALRFMQSKEETAEACSIPEQLDPQEALQAVAALSQEELSLLREIRDLLKENHTDG